VRLKHKSFSSCFSFISSQNQKQKIQMIRNILANSTLLLATTETEKLKEHPVILLPVAIRLLAFISMPILFMQLDTIVNG